MPSIKAIEYLKEEYEVVIDTDIEKFFYKVNNKSIQIHIEQVVNERSILNLMLKYLYT